MDRSITERNRRRDNSDPRATRRSDLIAAWGTVRKPYITRASAIEEQWAEEGILSDSSLTEPEAYSVSDEEAEEAAEEGLIELHMRRDPHDWRDWFSLRGKVAA